MGGVTGRAFDLANEIPIHPAVGSTDSGELFRAG
jgi:hypothetical protein